MRKRTDWRISSLLRESVERFEKHSERVGKILDRAQDMFENDHSSTVGVFGMVLIVCALLFGFLYEQWLLSGISMITGGGLLATALVIRHKSGTSQLKYADTLVNLERERARFEHRTAIQNHIWLYGLPEGTPLAQIQILLGDSPNLPPSSEGQLEWKALPLDKSTEEEEEEDYEEDNDDEDDAEEEDLDEKF